MWSLYKEDKFLQPLKFSNGKTQEDVVKEVLSKIKEGKKIIFIRGVCGTGKSAIALNIARNLGKSSIVVPGKTLQNQYQKDYENEKYLLKENGTKLKISVMTGRKNHECPFLKDNSTVKIKKEVDSTLNDIFSSENKEEVQKDLSADNKMIPCKIELKEKNFWKIKGYLKQNKKINYKEITEIKDVGRASVASICPYWSPVLPERYELKYFEDSRKRKYQGLNNTTFLIYEGHPGCKFYEQFKAFIEADVIVFNSLKYKLETILNRKPQTEVEIIDEGDEFLDSFSNQQTLSLDKLHFSLLQIMSNDSVVKNNVEEMQKIINHVRKDARINDAIYSKEIIPLTNTGIYDLLKIIQNVPEILMEADDESYLFDVEEIAKSFHGLIKDTYLTVSKKDNNLFVHLVTTNLAQRLKDLADKNKILVLMSGTIHSEEILKNIFGVKDYEIIDAEVQQQGSINVQRIGKEIDCKYSNFSSGKISRKEYLKVLNEIVETAKKPCLVHVNAFADLPSNMEKENYSLNNLFSREELKEMQEEDKNQNTIKQFKKGHMEILFSTKVARGIDFPGEECNSIVFTKYPNPNIEDAFWKILIKTKPEYYWEFYKDKAKRELWQKVYRGLRFKEDKVDVLSPDTRVLEFFEKGL
jgi:Rad3-related DNA helicase